MEQTGSAFTVSVAAVEVAVPQTLLRAARYCFPLSLKFAVNVSVAFVPPAMSVKFAPPSLLTCHCTAGAGLPLKATVNETELLSHTVRLVALDVTADGVLTVMIALPEAVPLQ